MRMTWMIASPPSPVVTTGEPTDESLRLMVENQLFLAPVPPSQRNQAFFFEFCKIAQFKLALLFIEQTESLSH